MAEPAKTTEYGEESISWHIPEYDKHERARGWYVISALVGILLIIYSFLSGNFLFAAIVIIGALVIIIHDGQEPLAVYFSLTDQGVVVGRSFYDYDVLKNFSIIYKPHEQVKNLYFEFKNVFKPRLSIPLNNLNPLPIRENLLKYLPEDLDRTNQPLSEVLAKLFKL